ncbi:MAG: hypothetical protein K0S81_988 [Rhodospirillales bacterium]|nr:hypothetical protein [Rhodospirillales bacterium]
MDARLLTLVGAIYEAATEPQRWSYVLQSLLADLSATHGALLFHNDRNSDLQYLALSGYSPDGLAAYREHFYSRDLWTLRGFQIPPGRAYVGEELVPEKDFRRSEIYNELYRFEGMEHSLGGQVVVEGASRAMIAFQRDGKRGEFSEEERTMLDLLLPHLARAVNISRLLLVQESRQAALNDILERLPFAVALLDGRGKVVFFNDKLKRIVDLRDGLSLANGALTPVRQEDAAELRKSIQALLRGAFTETSATMAVARKSGRRPPIGWRWRRCGWSASWRGFPARRGSWSWCATPRRGRKASPPRSRAPTASVGPRRVCWRRCSRAWSSQMRPRGSE